MRKVETCMHLTLIQNLIIGGGLRIGKQPSSFPWPKGGYFQFKNSMKFQKKKKKKTMISFRNTQNIDL